jgi:hypothetical protein
VFQDQSHDKDDNEDDDDYVEKGSFMLPQIRSGAV